MNAKLLNIPAHEYHADRVGQTVPTLSASIATTLVKKSPRHAWRQHPALGGAGRVRKSSDEQAQGTLIHALVLGKGLEQIKVMKDEETGEVFKDYRKKAAQEMKEKAEDAGLTPILAHKFAPMQQTANEIIRAIEGAGLNLGGMSEAVMTWTEDTEAGPIACRGMSDHILFDDKDPTGVIDLKTCHNAHPRACESHIVEYGYDIQRAAYLSALGKIRPDLEGRFFYKWVFAEIENGELIDVSIAEASGTLRELGAARWKRACETWAVCLRDNYWPGYGDANLLDAPAFALKSELGI